MYNKQLHINFLMYALTRNPKVSVQIKDDSQE